MYSSVLSVVQSPCVLVSDVCHLIDCFIPQVFSIVCHYLPVSVLFKPQCFSFWLLVHLIFFCTCPILPTPGSSLLCLCDFCLSVSVCFLEDLSFLDSCLALFGFLALVCDFVLLPHLDCSSVLSSACLLDLPLSITLNICLWNFILNLRMFPLSLILTIWVNCRQWASFIKREPSIIHCKSNGNAFAQIMWDL